ncbi:MAG: transcriptional regulator with XRE-family HTH domain [Flavobacterium sp.]|jgi:transcriptional regulator with XRE-family HTH domain
MKINAKLILELRNKNSWSQDELAIASGLNLRTVQRIEKHATASLQSRKALASALEIDSLDLECEKEVKVKCYEYKVMEVGNKEGFLTGIKKQKLPDLASIFNQEGKEGWLVVQILTPDLAQGMWSAKTGNMVALMQRERQPLG